MKKTILALTLTLLVAQPAGAAYLSCGEPTA